MSYLGYEQILKRVYITSNQKIDFQLNEESQLLDEVVLTNNIEKTEIKKPQMSVHGLSAASIKKFQPFLEKQTLLSLSCYFLEFPVLVKEPQVLMLEAVQQIKTSSY